MRFGLHRAINDALAGLDLIPLGPLAQTSYVDATIAKGESEELARDRPPDRLPGQHRGGRVHRATASCCSASGYPVTADGHPILVELENVDELFADPDAVPRCGRAWVLRRCRRYPRPRSGFARSTPRRRRRVRRDRSATWTRSGKIATVLADHPEGAVRGRPSTSASSSPRTMDGPVATRRSCTGSATSAASKASPSTMKATPTTSSTRRATSPSARSCSSDELLRQAAADGDVERRQVVDQGLDLLLVRQVGVQQPVRDQVEHAADQADRHAVPDCPRLVVRRAVVRVPELFEEAGRPAAVGPALRARRSPRSRTPSRR